MSILRVNQIQHSTGTAALTIDSSGRVVTPNRPFSYVISCTATFETTATTGVITGGNEDQGNGGMYNPTNGRFTVPVAGNYFICFSGLTQNIDINDTQVSINVNGVQKGRAYSGGYTLSAGENIRWRNFCFTGVLTLNANDYIEFNKTTGTIHSTAYPFRTVFLL